MHTLCSKLLVGAIALGLWAVASITPAAAVPVTLNFEFQGSTIPGTGTATFDPDGASTDPGYEYRPGDTFTATFTFASQTLVFTEADTGYILVTYNAGVPVDIGYDASINPSGLIDYADLSMNAGGWSLFYHTTEGDEARISGTYVFLNDNPEQPIPEPASALLLGAGLLLLGRKLRRV